jgi:hypothetical protein
MYSMLTGGHSQQTYTACETRGGITGIAGHIGIYATRLCVVDDLVEPDTLHLLRLVPRAWLRKGEEVRFENIPTIFGPVTVNFQPDAAGVSVRVDYRSDFHHPPKRTLIHGPPLAGLSEMIVNGRRIAMHAGGTHVIR